ncbi:hypothetical protein [Haladaptatus cibarius]|uniref:hypothetical protein n=1 Tax=Haladaptatus cibarius TaxID=453847 RepID=UPI000ABC5DF6|nr:hypothetical protein [Haladaptatus cibarius]
MSYSEEAQPSSDTVIRVSADAKNTDTGEDTRLSIGIRTDSVDGAIKEFESQCDREGYLIQEKPTIERE